MGLITTLKEGFPPSRMLRIAHPPYNDLQRGAWPGHETRWPLRARAPCRGGPGGATGREDSRTTHRVRCPSTPTTAATRNHVWGPRRSGTQGRKLATRPRPIRPDKRGGVASSEDRGRRARSGKEQAEQAAGTAGAVTTRIHLPTMPTNTRGPSTPPQGDGETQQRGAAPSTAGRETRSER
ncbi:hypothetical protein NDU88_001697 [Pleurodeles waltl]|uniref:Uncharacterized protein n=1 Tax=Pleurodeles waltl TaxID=8319 RepID=A0AAV7WJ75_PLEWA|nr:hypothetical protein NDU88_001697 [Pleurodeles waltl]